MLERSPARARARPRGRNPHQRELRRAQKRRERQRRRAGLIVINITVPELALLTALDRAGRLGQASPLGVAVELLISDFITAWTESVAAPLDGGRGAGSQSLR